MLSLMGFIFGYGNYTKIEILQCLLNFKIKEPKYSSHKIKMCDYKNIYPIIRELPYDLLQKVVDFLGPQNWNNRNDYTNLRECLFKKMMYMTPLYEPFKIILGVFNQFSSSEY